MYARENVRIIATLLPYPTEFRMLDVDAFIFSPSKRVLGIARVRPPDLLAVRFPGITQSERKAVIPSPSNAVRV